MSTTTSGDAPPALPKLHERTPPVVDESRPMIRTAAYVETSHFSCLIIGDEVLKFVTHTDTVAKRSTPTAIE